MVKIFYNDTDIFSGISPTPFVSRSISKNYGSSKQYDMDSFSLEGTIVGPCDGENEFSGLYSLADQMISRLSSSFKNFYIKEDFEEGEGIFYSGDFALIKSINFPEANYVGILPYEISLDIYPNSAFLGSGIVGPSQILDVKEQENGTVSFSKRTSAQGIQTELSAFDNAKNFVDSLTGIPINFYPTFSPYSISNNYCLTSLEKSLDRLNGTYSVDEVWQYNPSGIGPSGYLEFMELSVESGVGGVLVSANGSLKGSIGCSLTDLRNSFNSIDFFTKINQMYNECGGTHSLYSEPIKKSISESVVDRTITFNYDYSDTIENDPYIIDSFRFSYNQENNKNCVAGQITIASTDKCLSSRWAKVLDYYENFDILDYFKDVYLEYGYPGDLPNIVENKSVSHDKKTGTITINASACQKRIEIPDGLDDFNYTIRIAPDLNSYVPLQALNGGNSYIIQRLGGVTLRTISIEADGIASEGVPLATAAVTISNAASAILAGYYNVDAKVISEEVKTGQDRKLSFSKSVKSS